jgi:hypothetical protein
VNLVNYCRYKREISLYCNQTQVADSFIKAAAINLKRRWAVNQGAERASHLRMIISIANSKIQLNKETPFLTTMKNTIVRN